MVGYHDDEHFVDEKGRTRWKKNIWLAEQLGRLGDFLIIGGYEETHAQRYKRFAYQLSRWPEPIEQMRHEGRLNQLPDVGPTIAAIIGEYLDCGTSVKWEEWAQNTPESVVDLTEVQGLGVKMVRTLYQDYGIDSAEALQRAFNAGRLGSIRGLGPKTVTRIHEWLEARGL
ncbi:MAG: helix-hairpin-helix domain-containing protein [Candidatus Latescibacterota bacterium]|nr:helix-hairpin-helix domain-containing protein [Candidatus Latescibacterota bacterium]